MRNETGLVKLLLATVYLYILGGMTPAASAGGAVINEPPLPGSVEPAKTEIPRELHPLNVQQNSSAWIYLPLIFKSASDPWINTQDRQTVLNFYLNQYLSTNGVQMNWTGSHASCNPGTTSLEFCQAVLGRVNYFRAMAGIPATITFSDDSNRLAQAAALMMSVNRALNHDPPLNWTCYSEDGHTGAGSSNLFLGMYSWDAISGYVRDPGAGNSAAGHRRWILHPPTQVMGTGDIPPVNGYPSANSLVVFDNHIWDPMPPTRENFVAWPPPGYVPYQVIYPRWSFSVDGADFSAATVTLKSNGSSLSVAQAAPVNGYGDNTLVWTALGLSDWDAWPFSGTDTAYNVTIQNVLVNGQIHSYSYTVIAFNPTP